jgi:hypothetical protein
MCHGHGHGHGSSINVSQSRSRVLHQCVTVTVTVTGNLLNFMIRKCWVKPKLTLVSLSIQTVWLLVLLSIIMKQGGTSRWLVLVRKISPLHKCINAMPGFTQSRSSQVHLKFQHTGSRSPTVPCPRSRSRIISDLLNTKCYSARYHTWSRQLRQPVPEPPGHGLRSSSLVLSVTNSSCWTVTWTLGHEWLPSWCTTLLPVYGGRLVLRVSSEVI